MQVDISWLETIEAAYAAVLDPALWPEVLEQIARAINCQASTLWVMDNTHQLQFPEFTVFNFSPEGIEGYTSHYASLCPNAQYLLNHPNERIVHDGQYLTDREMDRHEYYDWQGSWSDMRYRILGQVIAEPKVHVGIAMHRTRKAGRFQQADVDIFNALFKHVERALLVSFRMGHLGAMRQWTETLLERSRLGVVLLGQRGQLIHANPQAQRIAAENDGIQLGGRGLSALRSQDQRELDRCVALASGLNGVPREASGMRIARPSGRQPYVVSIAPVSSEPSLLVLARPWVTVGIHDPGVAEEFPHEQLAAMLGLTKAEARLASQLAGGLDLREAATSLDIQYGSARARLASIFQKTQTRRQAELVRLILGLRSVA